MAKPAQAIEIEPPHELVFTGPFTEVVTSYLKLINPSDKQIAFKVKTTAPKQYCVRPNSGFIPSKGVVSVAVMLQPLDSSSQEERTKHKFMVQTTFVTDGETSLDNIWKNTPPHELMDSKLKVLFEEPNMTDKVPVSQTAQRAPPASNAEAEYRRLVDDTKRLQSQLHQAEQENSQLREKIMRFESSGMTGSSGGSSFHGSDTAVVPHGFTIIHMVAIAIMALLLGLIISRLF